MSDQLAQLRQPSVGGVEHSEGTPRVRKRSFRLEVLIGVILIAAGVIGAFWLRLAGNSTSQVVGVVRDLPVGHFLSEADLYLVDVDKEVDSQFVSADLRPTIVGSVVTSAVVAGPIARAAIQQSQQVLGEGEALIATAMEAGSFPPSLVPGDVVAIVTTPSTATLDGDVSRLTQTAVVFAVTPADDFNTKTVVTLRTAQQVAEQIAASGPVHLSIIQVRGMQ
jgi:hypothetical protein